MIIIRTSRITVLRKVTIIKHILVIVRTLITSTLFRACIAIVIVIIMSMMVMIMMVLIIVNIVAARMILNIIMLNSD